MGGERGERGERKREIERGGGWREIEREYILKTLKVESEGMV